MSIQAIGNTPAATPALELKKAPAPTTQAQSIALPVDKVSISPAAQKAASVDLDHDGDSH